MNAGPRKVAIGLRLFGGFSLERGGNGGDGLSYEKGRALLAYAAVEADAAHSRRALAALFWPDHPATAALANLRLVLLNLRQALEAGGLPMLQIDRDSVRFAPECLLAVDTARFSAVLAKAANLPAGKQISIPDLQELATAAALYRGEFLAGFSLPECPDFETWLQMRREAWHRDALSLIARIADAYDARLDHVRALPFAVRLLELAPWNEDAHRRVMRLLALNGQPGGALAQYETCCRILESELGLRPAEATRLLAEQISKGRLTQSLAMPTPLSEPAEALVLPTERRQVTVLFCELLATVEGEPDDAMASLYPAHVGWCDLVRKHGGHVVPTYAGGLLAYFGYPLALEHAARQALQATLAILGDNKPGVAVRIGVHTGMVVSGGSQAVPDVVGNTTAVAIRLRLLVAPGQIAVSHDVVRLVAGFYECVPVGIHRLPGISAPVEVLRVIGNGEARDRLDSTMLAPMIGRAMELEALTRTWEDARQGQCNVLLVKGDAGIGKSRLLNELKIRVAGADVAVRELRCYPEFSRSPFRPVIALFESIFGCEEGDDDAAKFARMARYLNANHPGIAAAMVPILASFMSLPACAPYADINQPLPVRREAELSMLVRLLQSLSERAPILLLVEDLHWADPSTLELVRSLVELDHGFPMLAVLTARSDFLPPWREDVVPTRMLAGLRDEEICSLISGIAPELPPAVIRCLVERADGIPLFAEELARLASGGEDDEVPATLRDLLAARLDATGEAKFTAQLAATIGRSFALDILSQVSPLAPQAVLQGVHRLVAADLLWSSDGVVYQFRHALIRDTAYQSQTHSGRKTAHLKIAHVLQTTGGRFVSGQPELIAQHLAAGEEFEQAAIFWLRAGNQACQRAAGSEAILHYKAGLAQVDRVADSPAKLQLAFDLLNGLGLAAIAVEGYASGEAAAAHARALALSERHAGNPDVFRAIWGLWASASSRSGYDLALDMATQLMRMAAASNDPVQVQQAHFAIGNTRFWRGEFADAKLHLEAAIGLHRPSFHARHITDFGEDVRITAGAYLSWVHDFLGQPEQAATASAETVALARRARHPFSLSYALTFAALLNCRLRQPDRALLLAEETRRLAESHGFHLWQIGAGVAAGWARAQQGDVGGVAEIRRCIAETRSAMGGVSLVVLAPLADALVGLRLSEEALATIDEALQIGEALGDHHEDAELLCLRGDALLALPTAKTAAAVAAFNEALALADVQQARGLESRARQSLAVARRCLAESPPVDVR